MKNAILLAVFGSKNIENELYSLKNNIKKTFKNYDIYICFTSVILSRRYGYNMYNILDYITKNNYNNVIYQPLFVIDGAENQKGLDIFNLYKHNFKKIYISSPLLSHKKDYEDIYSYITNDNKSPVLYITHGACPKYNAYFKNLYNMFSNNNIFFCSLENCPNIITTIDILKQNNIKNITVKPFFLTNGKHIKIDILGDKSSSIKNILLGYDINPNIIAYPLMHYKKIREIFINKMILGGDFYN